MECPFVLNGNKVGFNILRFERFVVPYQSSWKDSEAERGLGIAFELDSGYERVQPI